MIINKGKGLIMSIKEKTGQIKGKPQYDRLSSHVQVLLKEHEFKLLDRIRRESNFPSNAAYVRMLILKSLEGKKQLEIFP